jgi:hypothetical protein
MIAKPTMIVHLRSETDNQPCRSTALLRLEFAILRLIGTRG